MDNIWIILLIVGAVISLTQKNTKRRPQTDSDEEEQPRDVLQKHLEEIFGRGAEHPAAPRPTAMPMPQPPVRKPSADSAGTAPVTRPAAQSTASQQQNAEPKKHIRSTAETSARDTSHRNGTGNTQTTAAKAVCNTNTAIAQRFRRNTCTPQRQ